jgi:hypothetical protein
MNEIVVAIIALAGVVIGGILQHLFSKNFNSEQRLKELETQAYIDFIKATAGINSAQKNNDKDKEVEYTLLMLDAKARICIYGKPEIITALADFWRKGAKIEKKEDMLNFLEVIEALRGVTGKEGEVQSKDISQLIFGRDL